MSLNELTTGSTDGNGVFDTLMQSVRAHLDIEFSKNRLSGEEYGKVYTNLTTAVLQQSMQFLLSEPSSKAQVELINSQRNQVDTQTQLIATQRANAVLDGQNISKQGELLDKQVLTADEELARVKAQTSQLVQQTSNLVAEGANIPIQGELLTAQKANTEGQTVLQSKNAAIAEQQLINLTSENVNLGTQNTLLVKQVAKLDTDIALVSAQTNSVDKEAAFTVQRTVNLTAEGLNVPKQGIILDKQAAVLDEQVLSSQKGRETADVQIALTTAQKLKVDSDVLVNQAGIQKANKEVEVLQQRKLTEQAQILDSVDGVPVTGILGKQRELYGQQIEGYKRDAEQKVFKNFADVWSVLRTTDNGYDPVPYGFTVENFNSIVEKAKSGIGAQHLAATLKEEGGICSLFYYVQLSNYRIGQYNQII